MTTRPWVRPSVLAAALLVGLPGYAQPHAAPEHPLKRGLDAAWARQPEQQSATLRADAVAAARHAAQRWTPDAPTLELSGKTDRFHRNAGSREVDATLAVPLWLPGERPRTQAVAAADAAALDARLAAARLALAEQLRTAYWDHARAAQDLQLARERLRNARALSDDVARRVKAGDLAPADAHQAAGAVAGAEAVLAESQIALARVARHWQTLTGLPLAPDVEATAEAAPPESDAPATHPALQALSTQAEAARRARDLAGTQRWGNPELSIGAVRERGGAGERSDQSLVVGLRIPLGTSSASQARIATAGAEQLEAEVALARQTERIASGTALARDTLQALHTSADAADRRARLARESRGFFETSFRLGETDLPNRLRIELEAFEAERQAARARLERSAALSALRQALGLLPE